MLANSVQSSSSLLNKSLATIYSLRCHGTHLFNASCNHFQIYTRIVCYVVITFSVATAPEWIYVFDSVHTDTDSYKWASGNINNSVMLYQMN